MTYETEIVKDGTIEEAEKIIRAAFGAGVISIEQSSMINTDTQASISSAEI